MKFPSFVDRAWACWPKSVINQAEQNQALALSSCTQHFQNETIGNGLNPSNQVNHNTDQYVSSQIRSIILFDTTQNLLLAIDPFLH